MVLIADFIRAEMEPILQTWQEFASTIFRGRDMNRAELRDHAKEVLLTIAEDLDHPQSKREQVVKSKGLEPKESQASAAEVHGALREASGFSVNDAISEFRALRASVSALWARADMTIGKIEIEDLTRFNEAIDQAITESISSFTSAKEMQTRLVGTILLTAPDPIYVLDLEGRFIYANKATEDLYALPQSAIIGKNAFDLAFPFAADMQELLEHVIDLRTSDRGELSHVFPSGQGERFEYLLAPVLDDHENVQAVVGISHDITERKIAEETIWHNANYDLLTGLPNRRRFLDRLEQEVKRAERIAQPLAVLFIDLDAFKDVNDSLNHEAGDRLLCSVAERLRNSVRGIDTVARFGGDEFTVVLVGFHDRRDVEVVAQKIVDRLALPFHIDQHVVRISGSIGIALFPQNATTPDDLLRNADQAMYVAKNSGRNQIHFSGPPDS